MRVVRIITGMSLLTLFFVMGCRDVFEKDISEKEVVLVAPADSVETTRATLTFAWEGRVQRAIAWWLCRLLLIESSCTCLTP